MASEPTANISSTIKQIFDAIANNDADALAGCLKKATINTILKFESTYGISPLGWCFDVENQFNLDMVCHLLDSGLCDTEVITDTGRTVLANLMHTATDNDDLATIMLNMAIKDVDNATACYKVLKHNSLELFQALLSLKHSEQEAHLFEGIASAMVKLSAKNFPLSSDLQAFVLWKLSDYSYRHLSGERIGAPEKSSNEWKRHVNTISENWHEIAVRYDDGAYDNIDDRLLHRLHVIHNHLYIIQYMPFLEHLPMRDVILSLAIFRNIFKNPDDYRFYRLMVNKRMVMEFVRMITRQLQLVVKCFASMEIELRALLTSMEASGAVRKDSLIDEMLQKMETSNMKNKDHILKQFTARVVELRAKNCNRDTLINDLVKKLKTIDKAWTERKVQENRKSDEVYLIAEIKRRLPAAKHPLNVANRLISKLMKETNADKIVALVVAEESFSLGHLMSGRDRRTKRKLAKCYIQLKQFFSLEKITKSLNEVAMVNVENTDVFLACIKRVFTRLGEAMKSTKQTMNMPNARIDATVQRLLMFNFAEYNFFHRNTYAKKYSLGRLLLTEDFERRIWITVPQFVPIVLILLHLVFVIVRVDIRRNFYGMLYRCGSLRTMRSLLTYVGEENMTIEVESARFDAVNDFFIQTKVFLAEKRKQPVGKMSQFTTLEDVFHQQGIIVNELKDMLANEENVGLAMFRNACNECGDVMTARRLLFFKINSYHPNWLLRRMCTTWNPAFEVLATVERSDEVIAFVNPANVFKQLEKIQRAINWVNQHEVLEQTREIAGSFGIVDRIDEQALRELNKLLLPYYKDIFDLNKKESAVKTFCKARKLEPLDSASVRKRDEDRLQALFDQRRSGLRSILEQNGICTVDDLTKKISCVEPDALAALEYIQLEMCEMLITVGYFGDSFHLVTQRIPVIQGKNYRNQLAHDSLSYNLLTNSGDLKVVINAFIFANREVRLFGPHRSENIHLSFPSLDDTYRWVEEQHRLLAAFQADDVQRMHVEMRTGGEVKSHFCCSPNLRYQPAEYRQLTTLAHGYCGPRSTVPTFLNRYFTGFQRDFKSSDARLQYALERRDFTEALHVCDVNKPIQDEFFFYPLLASFLPMDTMSSKAQQECLERLIDCGNDQCVQEVLPHFAPFMAVKDTYDPLNHAIRNGNRAIAELLLSKTSRSQSKTVQHAIVVHWNDMLDDIVSKTKIETNELLTLLQTAALVNNYSAMVRLLDHIKRSPEALGICCVTAASYGVLPILQKLFEHYTITDSGVLMEAIRQAAINQHWNCVQLLLATVDVKILANRDGNFDPLLMLIENGQARLIDMLGSVDRSIYGTVKKHPLAVAVESGTATARMDRTLQRLGFRWLDDSAVLHEVILKGCDHPRWKMTWDVIKTSLPKDAALGCDRLTGVRNVLEHWKMITFVEEVNQNPSSVWNAITIENTKNLQYVLDHIRNLRTLEGVGVLGNFVIEIGTSTVCSNSISNNEGGFMRNSCDRMLATIEKVSSTQTDSFWQQFTIDVGVPVKFELLTAMNLPDPKQTDVRLNESATLLNILKDLMTITYNLFDDVPFVHASITNERNEIHFWRMEESFFVYDVYPVGSIVDLSSTINAEVYGKLTALHKATKSNCNLEVIKLLVEAGANPLLGDEYGNTPIHWALVHTTKPETALYIIEQCVARDLRNIDGVPLPHIIDRLGSNTLVHTAVASGHQPALVRLLQLGLDVVKTNELNLTPAHLAAMIPLYNSIPLMKMLLDHDRRPLDMEDVNGYTPLVHCAGSGSFEMLQLLMQYGPDLTTQPNRTALGVALGKRHIEWAKWFFQHIAEKGIRWNATERSHRCDNDYVVMSLRCDDFELSKALLEYDLEHTLEAMDGNDLPRIRAVLKGSKMFDLAGLNNANEFLKRLRGVETIWSRSCAIA